MSRWETLRYGDDADEGSESNMKKAVFSIYV